MPNYDRLNDQPIRILKYFVFKTDQQRLRKTDKNKEVFLYFSTKDQRWEIDDGKEAYKKGARYAYLQCTESNPMALFDNAIEKDCMEWDGKIYKSIGYTIQASDTDEIIEEAFEYIAKDSFRQKYSMSDNQLILKTLKVERRIPFW